MDKQVRDCDYIFKRIMVRLKCEKSKIAKFKVYGASFCFLWGFGGDFE